MLKRCYSTDYQYEGSVYEGCSVCEEWRYFSNFRAWMSEQNWPDMELDKDIIFPGNTIYSPETCVFVSRELNSLIRTRRRALPTGITYEISRRKYKAHCSVNGRLKNLGRFDNICDAVKAYTTEKIKEVLRLASLQTDTRVRAGLIRHAKALRA